MMSRWTYRVETVNDRIDPEILNPLGADGWELVAVMPSGDGRSDLIFKRPAPDFRAQITLDQRAEVTGHSDGETR